MNLISRINSARTQMIVVSSHLKRSEFKMRVLILSAFFACAAAAPSGLVASYIYQPLTIPAAIPTISPGDIQAAAIDVQVKANDLARAAVDKAQEFNDQAVENVNEKVVTDIDQINERNLEAFWSNEDKKWQAIDAVKTAEAQIDGAAASNADLYAKTAIGGAVPYVAAVAPVHGVAPVAAVTPLVGAPISPVIYNPYFSANKAISAQAEVKTEEKKEENQEVTVESAVKSAEPQKAETSSENAAEKPSESAAEAEKKPVVLAPSLIAPIPGVYRYNVVAPGPVLSQPFVKYASFPTFHGAFVPNFVQSVW
ncbi:unnamed protein product [Arctia plantaginis]|uniref:Uncharacterized protein n=2 Tax=Arctia plantaginis TaxID=874455 RepID=A0A8S1BHF0_ARCPL|nr:unnamed protein product [Arctia plantaginis]